MKKIPPKKNDQSVRLKHRLKFDSKGLIPAIVQDVQTKAVLMMAYMNRDALKKSLETGKVHFWSRSRKKLWLKGETSGHIQTIYDIFLDCDEDTLLIQVAQNGVACHTGRPSCFFYRIKPQNSKVKGKSFEVESQNKKNISILEKLERVIHERKRVPQKGSYVSSLFQGGQDLVLKKITEEAGELVIGSKNKRKNEIIHEMADLWFHSLVVLGYHGITLTDLWNELEGRFGKPGIKRKRGD